MFEQPKEGGEVQETIVGADVNLTGDLKSDGNITVRGKINGQVITKSDVVIDQGAEIEGTVEANNVTIDGIVKGNVVAKEDLELNTSGKIFGDINAKGLIVKKGAIFVGNSNTSESKELEPEKKEKNK
jgi:cytoskeletal protein CcmA (bactofilin family)